MTEDEAVLKVKRIFKVLSEFKNRTNSKVQTIIIEHAGENSWSEYSENVKLIRNWHGDSDDNALIPKQWIDAGV